MYPIYVAEIIDINGNSIKQIDDAISIQAARAFNVDGSATVVLPNYYDRSLFRLHTRMKLWRYDYSGIPALFGDTIWFLKKTDHSISEQIYTLTLVDAFAMIGTRIVAYTSLTPYADKTLEEFALVNYNNTLRLDTMMLAYMRENFGDLALDAERLNSYINVQRDKNQGPYGEKQAAWQELGSVLPDLAQQASANGLNLYYDLIPIEEGRFVFNIWSRVRGTDRSSTAAVNLVLSDTDGMIGEIHDIEDYTDVATVCYALGYDSGPSQMIETVESPLLVRNDPFGRIEMTVNASDSDIPSVLRARAQEALNGRRPKRLVTAKVVENSSLRYGRDITYGDLLSIEVAGRKYDVAVNAVSVTWDENGEQLDIHLSGEEAIGAILTGGTTTPGIPVPGETNTRPVADAGPDQSVVLADGVVLVGGGVDDGLPNPPAALTYLWSKVSGPSTVVFADDADPTTTATFGATGTYVLRLTVSDGELFDDDDIEIVVTLSPTVPPDSGLIGGQQLVAGIGIDGYVYRTSDFQTVSGSGGPTWTRVDTTIADTIYSFVVDPFSPGYAPGAAIGAINGWIVNDTNIYRVTDLFGTVVAASVFAFPAATVAASFHWRSIQASFGAYFAEGLNPWLLCVSYYGDTVGHTGTWATRSVDGGVTWSAEVQVGTSFDAGTFTRFDPIGVYASPKTPGLAYTAAHINVAGGPLPNWGIWQEDAATLTVLGTSASANAISSVSSAGLGVVQDDQTLILAPPPNAIRVLCTGSWSATITEAEPGNPITVTSFELDDPVSLGRTDDLVYIAPDVGSGGGTDVESGNFTVEWTFGGAGDWPVNTTTIISSPPTGPAFGARFEPHAKADADPIESCSALVTVSVTVTEIELDGGFTYTPVDAETDGFVSTDWGAVWAAATLPDIQPGQGQAGALHLPWPSNSDEQLVYYGHFDKNGNHEFKLKRAQGATITDISPVHSAISYGVHHYGFSVRSYDSDRQFMALGGIGNDISADPADDKVGLWVSSDAGTVWANILAPVAASNALHGLQIAFAGDSSSVLFAWGGWSNASSLAAIYYSSNFGTLLDSREGNINSLGTTAFIGIAGGPTP